VRAAAVHGVFSGSALERIAASPIESVLVTDSLPLGADGSAPVSHPKVEQVSVAGLFARAIEAIHDGTSVFELVS